MFRWVNAYIHAVSVLVYIHAVSVLVYIHAVSVLVYIHAVPGSARPGTAALAAEKLTKKRLAEMRAGTSTRRAARAPADPPDRVTTCRNDLRAFIDNVPSLILNDRVPSRATSYTTLPDEMCYLARSGRNADALAHRTSALASNSSEVSGDASNREF